MANLYRRRPIVVEAIEYTEHNHDEVTEFLGDVYYVWTATGIIIRMKDTDAFARPGDYIVRGMMGEIYPVKPDAFGAYYDSM